MKKLVSHTLKEYVDALARKVPAPGGGSVAALTAALAVGLIEMASQYSLGKGKSKQIEGRFRKNIQKAKKLRARFLTLVDLDAQAYAALIAARTKNKQVQRQAARRAAAVPKEICQKCYQAIDLTPVLVKNGNQNLISDLEIAVDLLVSSFNAALLLTEINQ